MKKGNISTGWIIAIILVVIVGGYFLISGDNADTPGDTEVMEDDPASATADESTSTEEGNDSSEDLSANNNIIVSYTSNGFSPDTISINSGETVTFENESEEGMWVASAVHPTHEVYDGTSLNEHCGSGADVFDACESLDSGSSWSFTFEKTGEWNYHNHTNASHTGTIIVE